MEDNGKQINRVFLFMLGTTFVCGQLCGNCLSNCDEETGMCSGRCNTGWDGPTCSRRNLAFQQSTTQSSDHGRYISSLAVDGRTGHRFFNKPYTCTHTKSYPQPAFWTVTLDAQYNIYRFRIYNRNEECADGSCGGRLTGFTLSVSNSSQNYKTCYHDTTTGDRGPGDTINGICNVSGPVLGDTVRIMINNSRPLTLCEVQIFLCTRGTYGPVCKESCGNCAEGQSVCDTISGHCPQRTPRCMPGYSGLKCDTVCTPGIYGEDCLKRCGQCHNQVACDTVSGSCRNATPRCMPGYSGPKCEQGPDCTKRCGQCAEVLTPCDAASGKCSERTPLCMPGYTGAQCDTKCARGTYGPECEESCGFCAERNAACNTTSGYCPDREPRCAPGYSDLKCDTVSGFPDYTGVIVGCSLGISLVLIIGVVILVAVMKNPRNNPDRGRSELWTKQHSIPEELCYFSSRGSRTPEPSSLCDKREGNPNEDNAYEAILQYISQV